MATYGCEYRIYIDGEGLDQFDYDIIETVTVEQGIDLATEARIEFMMFLSDQGTWNGLDSSYATSWQRVRIELRCGSAAWVPLIEGPVVQRVSETSSEPSSSTLTIIVRDDTVYLNHHATTRIFEGMTDDAIVKQLFKLPSSVTGLATQAVMQPDIVVADIPPRRADRPLQFAAWGTAMDALRVIAEPYDMHVYALPGAVQGAASTFYFKAIDTAKIPTLPTLVVVGPHRNIESFHVDDRVGDAGQYVGSSLSLADLSTTRKKSTWTNTQLLGAQTALDTPANVGQKQIQPRHAASYNLDAVGDAQQQKNSYTLSATGTIREACYAGVLTVYDVVNVSGADQRYCTKFVVKEIKHTLSRSEYRQDFTLFTNAVAVSGQGLPATPPQIGLP